MVYASKCPPMKRKKVVMLSESVHHHLSAKDRAEAKPLLNKLDDDYFNDNE